MLCQHVQNTQLIQNNILEKLSVPDETENILCITLGKIEAFFQH